MSTLNRTPEEIAAHTRWHAENDFFPFAVADLVAYLPLEFAREFLSEEAIKKYDNGEEVWTVREDPVAEIKDYMSFAVDKVVYHRGLSAGRSVDHMRAWLWLAGEEELLAFANDDNHYKNYGAPILKAIADHYKIDYASKLNPSSLKSFENMAMGKPCHPGCKEGCSA